MNRRLLSVKPTCLVHERGWVPSLLIAVLGSEMPQINWCWVRRHWYQYQTGPAHDLCSVLHSSGASSPGSCGQGWRFAAPWDGDVGVFLWIVAAELGNGLFWGCHPQGAEGVGMRMCVMPAWQQSLKKSEITKGMMCVCSASQDWHPALRSLFSVFAGAGRGQPAVSSTRGRCCL